MLNEAVSRYLWELDRQYISEQTRIYHEVHAALKMKYLNQHIAMRNGDIVDSDPDFQILFRRIRQRYGNLPVMITKVEEPSISPMTRRGFRMEASQYSSGLHTVTRGIQES